MYNSWSSTGTSRFEVETKEIIGQIWRFPKYEVHKKQGLHLITVF